MDRRAIVDCRELVGCRAFVNGRAVAYLSPAIANLVEVLRIHRLYLECDSVVDGTGMLTTGNSSQDNLIIEMLDFQLLWVQWLLQFNGGRV